MGRRLTAFAERSRCARVRTRASLSSARACVLVSRRRSRPRSRRLAPMTAPLTLPVAPPPAGAASCAVPRSSRRSRSSCAPPLPPLAPRPRRRASCAGWSLAPSRAAPSASRLLRRVLACAISRRAPAVAASRAAPPPSPPLVPRPRRRRLSCPAPAVAASRATRPLAPPPPLTLPLTCRRGGRSRQRGRRRAGQSRSNRWQRVWTRSASATSGRYATALAAARQAGTARGADRQSKGSATTGLRAP